MNLLPLYTSTADRAAELLARVGKPQLSASTPCAEWTVKDLVNHLIGGQFMFGQALAGAPFAPGEAVDFTNGDLAASFRSATEVIAKAMADPGLASATAALPFGPVPATQAAGIALFEAYVHTWDLARALNTTVTLDSNATAAVNEIAKGVVVAVPKEAHLFGTPVSTASADLVAQTIALTGRRP